MIKKTILSAAVFALMASCTGTGSSVKHDVIKSDLRAPAFPLVTIDPYTSAWSYSNNLYDEVIRHWTGKEFPLMGVVKVDGQNYRFMGTENIPMEPIAAPSTITPWDAKYTFDKPADDWMNVDFNDSKWKEGPAALGTPNEVTAKTEWGRRIPYVWARRDVNLDQDLTGRKVYLQYSHDDDVIIYINGIEVVNSGQRTGQDVLVKLEGDVLASLKQGKNVIAAWCWDRGGNALLDFGLVMEKEGMALFAQTAQQTSADVQAMQTHYTFTAGPVDLRVSFMAPLFMDDLELMSRPVNYITYDVESTDGQAHTVEVYFEAAPNWALNTSYEESMSEGFQEGNFNYVRTGSLEQDILGKRGDDIRIDWGYFYMAADKKNSVTGVGSPEVLRTAFVNGDKASLSNARTEKQADYLGMVVDLGSSKKAAGKIMLGYDDIYSIQYFGENIRPYWNRTGDKTIQSQFELADNQFAALRSKAYKFDKELMETATATGGKDYAELCALAYRQAIHAHKLIETPQGELAWLSKENNSNGSIGTVDITYPESPLSLYYNPELTKALMNFIFYYSESGKWGKPFAAHDVGTYPWANGQTYGGDMMIEESGNMVILTGIVSAIEGNTSYAEKHWEVLTTWADYLAEFGRDPENQLCTDDFAGHFAHNVNLSAKAIMGVAAYARMAEMRGMTDVAAEYTAKAKDMAAWWVENANDGDHYRLTFDRPGTWSQKYNLVWDKMLGFNIFPEEVMQKEIAYYLTKQNVYGLPLDNRETYTKTDWIMWSATMSPDQATFEKFIAPVHKFMNETVTRVPMSDWVYTDKPFHRGFKARAVVGGYWIKMLDDKFKANK